MSFFNKLFGAPKTAKIVIKKSKNGLWRWQFCDIQTGKTLSLMSGRGASDLAALEDTLTGYFPDYDIEYAS